MAIPEPLPYIAAYEKLGFGMFVHWGLYSQLGRGEWVAEREKLDMTEYEKLAQTFTAADFDPDRLVRTAREAGCRYVTLTTRHHEGFSLYDTCGLSDFDAPHSAAGRDLVREFVDACRRQGIVPFFYHTTLDWHHPDFRADFPRYLAYLRASVEVLCRNYGKIGGLWFDGNWSKPGADWEEDKLYQVIRTYQPEAMIINNTGLGALGRVGNPAIDAVTFEQGRPTPMKREGMAKYLAAEMCQTVGDHWGIGQNDINVKSPAALIENLCACRRVGANYLLNIGPTGQGAVDPYQAELFSLIGRWTALFGEAIYDGRPCAVSGIGKNFGLRSVDGRSLYLFVHDLATRGNPNVTVGGRYSGAYAFGGVDGHITDLHWMDNDEPLDFVQHGDMLAVRLTGYEYGKSLAVRVAKGTIA